MDWNVDGDEWFDGHTKQITMTTATPTENGPAATGPQVAAGSQDATLPSPDKSPWCDLCLVTPATARAQTRSPSREDDGTTRNATIQTCARCRIPAARTIELLDQPGFTVEWTTLPVPKIPVLKTAGTGKTADQTDPPTPHIETSATPRPHPIQHAMRKLDRELAVLDAEWLATPAGDREMIALAVRRLRPDGTGDAVAWTFRPTHPIDIDSARIHGFTNEALAAAPTFEECAPAVLEAITDADIAGYDVRHDITLLEEMFTAVRITWPDSPIQIVDGLRIIQRGDPRRLADTYRRFTAGNSTTAKLKAHDAADDTEMACAVVEALASDLSAQEIQDYTDPGRLDPAGKLARDENGQIILKFGKHRGRLALDHTDFLVWMLNHNFAGSTRKVVRDLLENRDPEKPGKGCKEQPGPSKPIDPEGKLVLDGGTAKFAFGRHKGHACVEQRDYLDWMIRSTDIFSIATIAAARKIRDGGAETPPGTTRSDVPF